ncbi:MoaD/ThiS family protein [Thalassotalea euphylliae]|uniref:sulfur carrier protein ThiS n=1 Tax=Thalassotalea euphylliae TaxID=1655234 RepID=UPI00362AE711
MNTYFVNGSEFVVEDDHPITLGRLLQCYFDKNKKPTMFAVAVNKGFVAQPSYDSTYVEPGAVVDLFSPIQGG